MMLKYPKGLGAFPSCDVLMMDPTMEAPDPWVNCDPGTVAPDTSGGGLYAPGWGGTPTLPITSTIVTKPYVAPPTGPTPTSARIVVAQPGQWIPGVSNTLVIGLGIGLVVLMAAQR